MCNKNARGTELQDNSLLQTFQTGSGAHLTSYSLDTGGLSPRDNSPPTLPSLRMRGPMILLPLYAFMVWAAYPSCYLVNRYRRYSVRAIDYVVKQTNSQQFIFRYLQAFCAL